MQSEFIWWFILLSTSTWYWAFFDPLFHAASTSLTLGWVSHTMPARLGDARKNQEFYLCIGPWWSFLHLCIAYGSTIVGRACSRYKCTCFVSLLRICGFPPRASTLTQRKRALQVILFQGCFASLQRQSALALLAVCCQTC